MVERDRAGQTAITDITKLERHVRKVPISGVAPSFDPGKHEGLLASLFRIVPAYPHIR